MSYLGTPIKPLDSSEISSSFKLGEVKTPISPSMNISVTSANTRYISGIEEHATEKYQEKIDLLTREVEALNSQLRRLEAEKK